MSAASEHSLDGLRNQLLSRVEAHPVRTWSPNLLAAMIALFDAAYEQRQGPEPRPGFRPYVVGKGTI
ncbi:hypothetical protein BST27_18600 [Mycobacterium intermedium]|uniref:Uncharacterized protein n=1 Tax=Mycobacterium intermedium TaxID=28445 RepID=A0A1E3SEU3_MYCIE|nr:hypothetical protein [Mycobacterium intermedium]MCV6963072.1 hypothetical protein [Mycobacterium intermedium]ODR00669.1 hypothetical protein BHQ20_11800 [Mycobacterium intermedium]OPE52288.1 hypothetical protein BV508_02780 [Mycobacterium intermedium]ORB00272.1 hypothetical protein BST27_18600 [Mycobacterium intermedium]